MECNGGEPSGRQAAGLGSLDGVREMKSLELGMRCERCSVQAEQMKNIFAITAATAVLFLASCGSNDIVVTSEVGEKLIVERDTIRLHSNSKNSIEGWKTILETHNGSEKYLCDGHSHSLCIDHRKDTAAIKHRILLNDGPVWTQEYRFIPIMRDRNGKDTVSEENFITCVSPKLPDRDKDILNSQAITKVSSYNTRSLTDTVARTICSEYPKWE